MLKKMLLVMSFSLCALAVSGCAGVLSPLAGEWGQMSKDRNDVAAIKAGMRVSEVMNKIGKPQQMEEGDNIYIGWQQWIYPTGMLLVYRGEVKSVHVMPRTKEVLDNLAQANKKGFEFGFEDTKESTRKQDEADLARQKNEMWGVDRKVAKNPHAKRSYSSGALAGFSSVK